MTEKQKLLPCPFCGGIAYVVYFPGRQEDFNTVRCSMCGAQPWSGHFKNINIIAWNNRKKLKPTPKKELKQ